MPATRTAFPEKQARCWHPVAYAHEVTDQPVGATLLGEAVVVWRTSDGRAHAMRDLCIHRGTALSLGWIAGDCLVCPYHAWHYDASGACVRIPQSATAIIPAKARTPVYRCQERYGLVWVCLAAGEPAYALPEDARARIRRLEGGEHRAVRVAQRRVAAGGELHRLRPLPVGASRPAGRSRAASRARPQGGHRRARAALHDRASRGAQQRRASRCSPTPTR